MTYRIEFTKRRPILGEKVLDSLDIDSDQLSAVIDAAQSTYSNRGKALGADGVRVLAEDGSILWQTS